MEFADSITYDRKSSKIQDFYTFSFPLQAFILEKNWQYNIFNKYYHIFFHILFVLYYTHQHILSLSRQC